jgi:Ribosomal protein L4
MRRRALAVALFDKLKESEISGLVGAESVSGKTGQTAKFLSAVANHPKTSVLIITDVKMDKLYSAVTNMQGVTMKTAGIVNAYDLVSHDHIIMTKDALDAIIKRSSL